MQGLTYNVDIVMCIDCTGSMHGILDTVKKNALSFYDDLQKALEKKEKNVEQLRVKVIAFRDYYCDGADAMSQTEFLSLPEQKEEFSSFVNPLTPSGGGDEPENGLEALALAINSDWNKDGDKRREIVIMWSDASAHKLELNEGSKPSNYPSDMPKDFDELTDMWEGQSIMSGEAKRLLIFAPDAYPWTDIETHWEKTIQYPSKAGAGLSDVDYETILDTIVQSV